MRVRFQCAFVSSVCVQRDSRALHRAGEALHYSFSLRVCKASVQIFASKKRIFEFTQDVFVFFLKSRCVNKAAKTKCCERRPRSPSIMFELIRQDSDEASGLNWNGSSTGTLARPQLSSPECTVRAKNWVIHLQLCEFKSLKVKSLPENDGWRWIPTQRNAGRANELKRNANEKNETENNESNCNSAKMNLRKRAEQCCFCSKTLKF